MLTTATISSAFVVATFITCADAHGYIEQPKATWKDSPNPGWVTNVDNYWDIGSGGDQVGAFKKMAEEKGMSVKDVVLDMVGSQSCGNTLPDGEAQPVPTDGKAKWLGNGGGGFTHTGPCEIYLDDKMVLHSDDCEDEFKGGDVGSTQTSDMPVDYSSCNGKCLFTIYWLAFQNEQWQSYVNCVPLTGSGSSATQAQASSTGADSTDAPSTETQGSNTETPSTSTQSTEASSTGAQTPSPQATEAPLAAAQLTQAPSPATTQAPSTETEAPEVDTKCIPTRRLRKMMLAY
ncbi:hypothetical protein PHYBOEH_008913 [Phytophthora boehmeriae]|uniref:Uncharacterized protein n=1 Tax=Phytophthora boehmeriae TaxID=109152 RepID=A0A8T1X6A0_9STRA|nr:hypothetical protein PHYBOEH_008913 [Phytophthora boehmeriae]